MIILENRVIPFIIFVMSISNPFTRPSPFRPSSYNNNKIQQSHVSPFTPQSENYSKWQPKYSLGNDYSKPSYNNYGGSTSTFPDSYTYQNKNMGGGLTGYGNSNEKYSMGTQYNAAYIKKQAQRPSHDYSPKFQIEYGKETNKDLFSDKNPFNRPSLFQRPSISISTPYKQKSYDVSPKNYDNYRYYGDRTNDYTQQYSPNKVGYMARDFDTKSDTASVATYINKIIEIDDKKSEYASGLNSSRLGANYKNKNSYNDGLGGYTQYGKFGVQENSTEMFKDYEHLKYRPSLKEDKNESKGSGGYGGDKYKMYAISQKQLHKSDEYLDDGTGKFGRSKTNNEEEYEYRQSKYRKNMQDSDYERDYKYKKNYLQDQIYTKIKDNYQLEEKNNNKFDEYDFRKKVPQQNQPEKFKYSDEGRYSRQLYQPINHHYDNKYNQKYQEHQYGRDVSKNNDYEIQEKRKQLQFEDYHEDEEEEPASHFGTKNRENFESKKVEESESDKDAYYDFEKEDSFEENLRNKKKSNKIWDRNTNHNRHNQNTHQENYAQPTFGKNNQRPDQYSSPEFYGFRKNKQMEQVVQEPSLQDVFNNNEVVRFEDVSEEESEGYYRKQRKNVPSNDVDTPQKYPKIVQIHGTIFHRVELQLN